MIWYLDSERASTGKQKHGFQRSIAMICLFLALSFQSVIAYGLIIDDMPFRADQVVFNEKKLVQGVDVALHTLNLDAGDYYLELKDYAITQAFDQLTATLSTATEVAATVTIMGVSGVIANPSTSTSKGTLFQLSSATNYYLATYGLTKDQTSIGFYEVTLAQVPLPLSWVFFVSGLSLLVWMKKRG